MAKNNAALYDINQLIAAGINPKTGLPIKFNNETPLGASQGNIYQAVKVVDVQDALSRFTWYNLPEGLDGEMIERILYYKGQLMLFRLGNKFYSLPFCLNGEIDVYGRYETISPLPFNGTANDGDPEKPWIQGLEFDVIHEAPLLEDYIDADETTLRRMLDRGCVIMRDYSYGRTQTIIPREQLNDGIIQGESLMVPYMETNLLTATGIHGMRVGSADESSNVMAANQAFKDAALHGTPYVPIIGTIDFQELSGGSTVKPEEYMLAMQSLDNLRLSLFGLDNGGLFQKKAHMLVAEQEMAQGVSSLSLENALRERQKAITIFNTIFGTNAWVDYSESTLGIDRDGDMVAGNDGSDATEAKIAASAANEGGETSND